MSSAIPDRAVKKPKKRAFSRQAAEKIMSSAIHDRTTKKTKKKGATAVAPKPPKEDGGVVQTKSLILGSKLLNHQE